MSDNESNESRETVADEIKICPLCGGRVFWFPISNYWGCENCKNTFNRYTVFPDEVKKTSAVGNAAAMREALVSVRALIDDEPDGTPMIDAMKATIDAALSEPPRNCDVGTADSQIARFNEFCDSEWQNSGSANCGNCPLWVSGRIGHDCQIRWEQMPYTAEEGGAE